MKKVFDGENGGRKAKEDIDAIKKDIQELTDKLKNLKDDSLALLSDQFDNFTSVVNDYKDKGKDQMRSGLADLYLSTRQHPMRNLACAFIIGAFISLFCYKK